MSDRFKSWMKSELDIEWSAATSRHLSPALTADFTTLSKRILAKDKMTRIDLEQKIGRLRRAVEQKQNGFSNKKHNKKKTENDEMWNVFSSLLEKFTDSPANQQYFQLKPDNLSTDKTLEELENGIKAWQSFEKEPRSSDDSSSQKPIECSYQSIKDSIPNELTDIAKSIHTLKGHLLENPIEFPEHSPTSPEESIPNLQNLEVELLQWSKLFEN